jgi:hypothetical protein
MRCYDLDEKKKQITTSMIHQVFAFSLLIAACSSSVNKDFNPIKDTTIYPKNVLIVYLPNGQHKGNSGNHSQKCWGYPSSN